MQRLIRPTLSVVTSCRSWGRDALHTVGDGRLNTTRPARRMCLTLAVAMILTSASAAFADNWPQWRGPTGNGLCTEKNIPTKWSNTENVAWRLPLPGASGATPVIWDDRVFLTAADGDDLLLMCVSTDGKEQWRQVVGRGNRTARRDEGNSASPSPVTDGEYVWSFMGNGSLGCYSVYGEKIWNFDVEDRYGKFNIQFGMTSTPVLHGDHLYLQLIHGEGDPTTREALVVALNKRDGTEVWKHDRVSDAIKECEHSYASPILYEDAEKSFLVTHGADYTVAHRLTDGSEIWRCGGLNVKSNYDRTLRFVASPAAVPGLIVIPSAKRGPVVAVSPNGEGDISETKFVLWKQSRTPDVPSPLIVDDLVYLCMENGNLHCHEAKTGKELYAERTHRIRHRASPLYADGHVYLSARDGRVTVVKAGRQFEVVAENEIGESLSASPAVSNGTIYLRSFDALWAIRQK